MPTDSWHDLSRRVALLGAAGAVPSILGLTAGRSATEQMTAEQAASVGAVRRTDRSAAPADDRPLSDATFTRLQDAVAAVGNHSVLVVSRHWTVNEPIVLDRPLAVRFAGGSLATDRDIDLVVVRSSDVRIVDAVLRGSGAEQSGLGRGIHVAGSVSAPLADVHVVRADIRGFSHDGVLLEHSSRFSVTACEITDVGYAGVLMFSCVDGTVSHNRIARVTQPSPYPNSYGIEAVRVTTGDLTRAPRSARIVISDNHVSDVPHWEGIDTHGGEAIAIVRNRVEGCRVGIAIVPSKDEDDASATKYAPIDCSVIDNVVSRQADGPGSGIIVRGAGERVGSTAERATGTVLRNSVTGYGDGDRDAAILTYLTRGLLIAHNRCADGLRRGVSLYHSNNGITLVGNTVSSLRQQGSATSVAVDVRATENRGLLMENRYVAGAAAGVVYGVLCRQPMNDLVLVANDWTAATTPVVATAGVVVRYRED